MICSIILGITANYTGFFHMGYAVKLCCERPERLLMVTKWVYPEVAKHYQTNGRAVERNIRTVGKVLWEQNRPALEQLAGRPLPDKPGNAQLLAMLSHCLLVAGGRAFCSVRERRGGISGDHIRTPHPETISGGQGDATTSLSWERAVLIVPSP